MRLQWRERRYEKRANRGGSLSHGNDELITESGPFIQRLELSFVAPHEIIPDVLGQLKTVASRMERESGMLAKVRYLNQMALTDGWGWMFSPGAI